MPDTLTDRLAEALARLSTAVTDLDFEMVPSQALFALDCALDDADEALEAYHAQVTA